MWQPASGCGPGCRSEGDDPARHGTAALRLAGVCAVLLLGLGVVPLVRRAAVRAGARVLLALLGVRLVWRGPLPRPGSLLVANHVSWLDILALHAVLPVRLVAKREVRDWPGVGALAAATGAIFLDRARPRTLPRTVAEVAAALRAGRSVAVFPEGTTFCGARQGRFRPAVFQAAVDAGAPVAPVSIRYDSTGAAFVGDDTLWASVRRVAALRALTVTLVAAPALRPTEGADRRALARAAQASVGVTSGFDLAA
ncbi:1-acyl-sn-glycerol-3-phosphate acyltransferase [Krasilnikovia cinnamomea]|uniref:1-acyl-sn-glycerol-3-phosphate acyltransferase n=1 Tax=Krasilnikovia cinnamomea TaxID=349313 RepID=A0A4Q7ZIR6_9ACTN|nr:lysophospholipid acyltransferase family protein [Krasilnikovia cinnamomea]RZU50019.1 1-acyl-sn-glycerol-3-phosphate acyltransferase [Krasilnikovia cinnamomea]